MLGTRAPANYGNGKELTETVFYIRWSAKVGQKDLEFIFHCFDINIPPKVFLQKGFGKKRRKFRGEHPRRHLATLTEVFSCKLYSSFYIKDPLCWSCFCFVSVKFIFIPVIVNFLFIKHLNKQVFHWSEFSLILTESRNLCSKSLDSVNIWENWDQRKLYIGTF